MVIIQMIENIVRYTDWASGEVQETCIKSWLVEHDGKRHQRNFDKEIKWDIQDSNKVTRMKLRRLSLLAGVKPAPEPEEEDEPEITHVELERLFTKVIREKKLKRILDEE